MAGADGRGWRPMAGTDGRGWRPMAGADVRGRRPGLVPGAGGRGWCPGLMAGAGGRGCRRRAPRCPRRPPAGPTALPSASSAGPAGRVPGSPAPPQPGGAEGAAAADGAGPGRAGQGRAGSRGAAGSAMGLETEKADTRIFMDDDNFPRSGGPALSEAEKCAEDELDRDPHGLNAHLQLGFEDVIAEPELTHSFDKVWICSHALFELSKYLIYKLLTLVLAIPLALVVGIVFAVLSCLHIWIVVPFVKTCLMVLPSVQTIWKSLTDVFVVPFFQSIGRCFAMVNIHLDQE